MKKIYIILVVLVLNLFSVVAGPKKGKTDGRGYQSDGGPDEIGKRKFFFRLPKSGKKNDPDSLRTPSPLSFVVTTARSDGSLPSPVRSTDIFPMAWSSSVPEMSTSVVVDPNDHRSLGDLLKEIEQFGGIESIKPAGHEDKKQDPTFDAISLLQQLLSSPDHTDVVRVHADSAPEQLQADRAKIQSLISSYSLATDRMAIAQALALIGFGAFSDSTGIDGFKMGQLAIDLVTDLHLTADELRVLQIRQQQLQDAFDRILILARAQKQSASEN